MPTHKHKKICWVLLFVCIPFYGFAETPENIPGATKIGAEDVIRLTQSIDDLIIIDARMDDRNLGYIEGSVNLPDIDTNCDTLSLTINKKSQAVIFYCNGPKCGRSAKSVKIALKCGYSTIYWYRDGFQDWKEKGFPYITR